MFRENNRLRDAAFIVPLGGVVLFLPPYVLIFDQAGVFHGIPFLHIALFASWFVGIILTAVIARLLIRADQTRSLQSNLEDTATASNADEMGERSEGNPSLDHRTS